MASPYCLRCLRRSLQSLSQPNHIAAFSTTAPTSARAPPKIAPKASNSKKGRTLRLAKNTRAVSARPPAAGERRAVRKRIVLSNTNALEVQGLQDLTGDKLERHDPGSVALDKYAGQVLGFTDETVDALRALESFKPTQGWSLFRRPASLIRAETAVLANDLADAGEKRRVVRRVLHGPKLSGKSVLLLQAHAMAFMKGWVVVHLPEGQDLTNGHTSYLPVNTPEGRIYAQPHYTAKLLGSIARANQTVLSSMQLSQQHRLPIPVQSNISLDRFAEIGANDPDLAWPIWQALWSELTTTEAKRPPVLVSMDAVDRAMCMSAYLDAEMNPIHAHDLALIRDFTRLLSGETRLPNGGVVLGGTCESNRASAPTLDYCLERSEALAQGAEAPKWNPFLPMDSSVESVMKSVQSIRLQGLSKTEARGVMEYYARSGMFRETVTEGLVSEKWTLAGSGIVGELERASVRARF